MSDRTTRTDLLVLGSVALLLRLPALFASRHLTFDDGVFGASIDAMRRGGVPFREVFSSQGPLFLPIVFLGDLLGFRTDVAPRLTNVVAGVALAVLVYLTGRRLSDRTGGLLAGGLVAVSGSVIWVTAPIASDGPALVFAVLAVLLALRHRGHPTPTSAAVVGLAVGAALSVKAIQAPVLVPVVLVLGAPLVDDVRRRRLSIASARDLAVAGASAVAVFVVVSLPWGLADVWDQAVAYRTDAAVDPDPWDNLSKIVSTSLDRDPAVWVFGAVALVLAVVAWRRGGTARVVDDRGGTGPWRPTNALLTLGWAVTTLLWLVAAVSPLWRPHVSGLIPAAALAIAVYRPPIRVTSVVAVVVVPVQLAALLAWPGGPTSENILWPRPYRGDEADIVAVLEDLPPDSLVISDEPGLPWRAGRGVPEDLVDASMLQVQQGRITEDRLARAAADPDVCAVVVRSGARYGSFDGLGDRLAAEGYAVALDQDGPAVVYVRDACTGANSGS